MPKLPYNPAEYSLVAERITELYQRFPQGRIISKLVSRDRDIVFRAKVFRKSEDPKPAATGWASEREGDGEINLVACLENAETSAIGRALANLGFTASKKRASLEEMEKAARTRLRYAERAANDDPRANPQKVAERPPASPVRMQTGLSRTELLNGIRSEVINLVSEATSKGVPSSATEQFEKKAASGHASLDELTAIQRRLRYWIVNGYAPINTKPPTNSASVNTPHQ
jgi:hypothetical protein